MVKTLSLFPEADDDFKEQSPGIPGGESNAGGVHNDDKPVNEPKPYHNRTQPSRAAAESARSFVRSQVARVHAFIEGQGELGATDAEIQAGLNLDGNSERPRRVWLRNNGFVQQKGFPDDIVLRDGSTVWVTIRPLELNATRSETMTAG